MVPSYEDMAVVVGMRTGWTPLMRQTNVTQQVLWKILDARQSTAPAKEPERPDPCK